MTAEVVVVVGTRPEIIKMAPVVHALVAAGVPHYVLHTGQHYDDVMDGAFFRALDLDAPAVNLRVGSGAHGAQTARILAGAEPVLEARPARMVLVQGDTNTAMAVALAAVKLHIPVGHVEAGLRSYDRRMPEETNRVIVDHIANHLFAPTPEAAILLRGEGLPAERVEVTGNTIVDVVARLDGGLAPERVTALGLEPDGYVLVTAHRPENVDRRDALAALLDAVDAVATEAGLPALYPCHPRTRARLAAFGLAVPASVRLAGPAALHDFLALEKFARLILTDSGGVQEEACILRVPCVTLRENTERPETVTVGANRLAGLDRSSVVAAARAALVHPRTWANPLGDGHAGERIAAAAARGV
jgi:UDP-N-acetylglucosamine 2-epimerase (non-hydrolysing)